MKSSGTTKPIDIELHKAIEGYAKHFFPQDEFPCMNDYYYSTMASFVMGWIEYDKAMRTSE